MHILSYLVLFCTLVKKDNNEVELIAPKSKLKFPVSQKSYKKEIILQLAEVSGKKIFLLQARN